MISNLSSVMHYINKALLNKKQNIKSYLIVVLCFGTLAGCDKQRIMQTPVDQQSLTTINETPVAGEKDIYKKVKSKMQEARENGFLNCGVFNKDECDVYLGSFKTLKIETIVESQSTTGLTCCVTRITLEKKEQNCIDLSEHAEQLNNSCPLGWWETSP